MASTHEVRGVERSVGIFSGADDVVGVGCAPTAIHTLRVLEEMLLAQSPPLGRVVEGQPSRVVRLLAYLPVLEAAAAGGGEPWTSRYETGPWGAHRAHRGLRMSRATQIAASQITQR
jgi:hypothetical protein